MTLVRTTMLAGALCFAPAFANDSVGSTAAASSSSSDPAPQALEEVLRLDDAQIDALEKLRFELEDAAFPLYQKLIQQQWELHQAYRSQEPNIAAIEMLHRDLNQTLAEAKELAGKYRARSLALLTPKQNFALYSLQMALRLRFAATEAVNNNLIEDPFGGSGMERILSSYGDGGSISSVFNDGL